MPMMDTATAARLVQGRPIGPNAAFTRVSTDSRTLAPGELFVALAGERFDGHDHVDAAFLRGAAAAMVDAARADRLSGAAAAAPHGASAGAPAGASTGAARSLVAVRDTTAALGALAAGWRARFAIPLCVVTGSNGKTTTKEMLAAMLRAQWGSEAVLATRGNFNNAIGLPLTLLALRAPHRAAAIELGMNHRGETRVLAAIAAPTIAVVNNAQREHQEFMAGVAAVAAEHADAIRALPRGEGVAVFNADDAHAGTWRDAAREAGVRALSFGLAATADVRGIVRAADAQGSTLEVALPDGERFTLRVPLPGEAMQRNALAAAAAAHAAGVAPKAIAEGLAGFRAVAGRLAIREAGGATIIDDSYNANPDSVRAGIDVLASAAAPRVLVLGDMGEVGQEGPRWHREAGTYARERGVARLLALGEATRDTVAAFGEGARHFDDVESLVAALRPLPAGATVLVKGSRFMRMERVVAALAGEDAGGGAH